MANPKGNPRWKKGESGNPNGRPKLPKELLKTRQLTPERIQREIAKVLYKKAEEVREMVTNPDTPVLQLMIASIAMKAVTDGDHAKMNFLMERTVGKVKETKEIELRPVTYRTEVLTDGTLLQEIIDMEKLAEGEDDDERRDN